MNRILIFLIFAFFLSCSEAVYKYGYENGDILIINRLDNYFDLNEQQEKFIANEYQSFKAWHRKKQLPKYQLILKKLSQSITDDKFTAAYYQQTRKDLDKVRLELWAKLIPKMAQFMETLEPEQAKQYIENMKDQTAEYQKYKKLSKSDRYQDRHAKTVEFIERISGPLNETQVTSILEGMMQFGDPKLLWLEFREKRNTKLQALLLKRSTAAEYSLFFQQWYAGSPKPATSFKSFQNRSQSIFSGYQSIFVPLVSSFTQVQRDTARDNLQSWIKILRDLQAG